MLKRVSRMNPPVVPVVARPVKHPEAKGEALAAVTVSSFQ